MIACFSFCESDLLMALELAKHIACLGGVSKYSCLSFHPDKVDGRDIFEHLTNAFSGVVDVPYRETLHGWPDGPNQCFVEAARWVESLKSREPWLWLEADCVPTRSTWLDEIEGEYQFCGKSVLGVINSTFDLDGKVNGEHVTGVAVYPANFFSKCSPLRSLVEATDHYRKQGHCPPAFDCYIAPYAVPNCAKSEAIHHFWKSYDFREAPNGMVFCKFQKDYRASNKVDLRAALIHGAKDFSLLDIVQRRLLTQASVNTIRSILAC